MHLPGLLFIIAVPALALGITIPSLTTGKPDNSPSPPKPEKFCMDHGRKYSPGPVSNAEGFCRYNCFCPEEGGDLVCQETQCGYIPGCAKYGERTKTNCCPACIKFSMCFRDMTQYHVGEIITSGGSCKTCRCTQTGILCTPRACPALPIDCEESHIPEARCCPVCTRQKSCKVGMNLIGHGQEVPSGNTCLQCRCMKGVVQCYPLVCPKPTCENAVALSGQCCPSCPDTVGMTPDAKPFPFGQ